MRISLIGPMAAGKSTVGQLLADRLHWPFYDTDTLIETARGKSISQIFAEEGEDFFRNLETIFLKKLLTQPESMVIATGGGIVKKLENRSLLQTHSQVVFLDLPVTEQLQRTAGDTSRPILMVENKVERLEALRQERLPLYQEIASLTLQTHQAAPEELAHILEGHLKISKNNCQPKVEMSHFYQS